MEVIDNTVDEIKTCVNGLININFLKYCSDRKAIRYVDKILLRDFITESPRNIRGKQNFPVTLRDKMSKAYSTPKQKSFDTIVFQVQPDITCGL